MSEPAASPEPPPPAQVTESLFDRWSREWLCPPPEPRPAAASPPDPVFEAICDWLRPEDGEPAAKAADPLEDTPVTTTAPCLVVVPDGEPPRLVQFRTWEGLADYLATLENTDTYAIPFVGTPAYFSTGPVRYVFLPDLVTAAAPSLGGRPARLVPAQELAVGVQEDFHLAFTRAVGPPWPKDPEQDATPVSDAPRVIRPRRYGNPDGDDYAGAAG